MPSKQQSGQKRAQGGGRTANSEPKLQVFRDFNGVNFEQMNQYGLAPSPSIDVERSDGDQTDLQMNFMFLQNNVGVMSNKTLGTRDDIVELFSTPSGISFTGPVRLIGPKMYAAKSDNNVGVGDLNATTPSVMSNNVTLNGTPSGVAHTWTALDYYDNKLIAQTSQNDLWTADIGANYSAGNLENAAEIANPTNQFNLNGSGTFALTVKGDLRINASQSDTYPFVVKIGFTYVNKYGPTKLSTATTFYANHPVSEWSPTRYLQIKGAFPSGQSAGTSGVRAVELYYSSGNAMTMLFMGRVDVASTATSWSFNWLGYIDVTSMWPTANLIAPTANYTKGVHASKMCNIDGRLYFWGDSANPQRLYIGGNPGNLLSISPGTGGGFVDVEPGTGQQVRHVCKYKTQSGASIVTMLCDSPNSRKEQRFNLVENNISLSNEQNMKSWQAEQVAGAVGCKSYDGAVVCEDGLYSVSRYGLALTTMTMEYNSQIRTNFVSDAIKPVFTDSADMDIRLSNAMLIELDGIIYMAFGSSSRQGLDNVIFCYDIDLKAWWTYTLDLEEPILNLFHVDWQGKREGIGIVTAKKIYMLPTTVGDDESTTPHFDFLIQSSQLSTQMPQQGWQYLSQLEFHFDRFVGSATIEVRMVDMFGRDIKVKKVLSETNEMHDYVVRMRVDQRVMSYVITMKGRARFRMSHFIARVYTMSNKIGQVWGFDDSISYRSAGSVRPTFKCYNDLRKAIFT